MRSAPVALAALLLAPFLAGCLEGGGPAGTGRPAPIEEPLRSLAHGSHSGVAGPLARAIESKDAWHALWAEHAREDGSEPPPVHFAEERVVAVVLGERPNGCYAVNVTRVVTYPDEERTVVNATERVPPPDAYCIQVMTNPYHFVAVPARATAVEFRAPEEPPSKEPGEPSPPPAEEPPSWRTIEEGSSSGVTEARRTVVADAAAWRALWAEHARPFEPAPPAPDVDFAKERVAAAFLGARPDSCHALRVEGVEREADGGLRVRLVAVEPGPDAACADVVTHPFVFVAVPAGDAPVTWEERTTRA